MKLLFILLLGLGFTQTKLETRQYSINLNLNASEYHWLDMEQITGHDLSNAIISIISIGNNQNEDIWVEYRCLDIGGININISEYGLSIPNNSFIYIPNNECNFQATNSINEDVVINITAEFPEEDTGYIEDGFEFCLTPGANLLSFPCDNPINVGESLPQGVENFITEIVGQGVAASYNPALGWIGNLAEFTPGSGYWFKSNESLCFEYDCVED